MDCVDITEHVTQLKDDLVEMKKTASRELESKIAYEMRVKPICV